MKLTDNRLKEIIKKELNEFDIAQLPAANDERYNMQVNEDYFRESLVSAARPLLRKDGEIAFSVLAEAIQRYADDQTKNQIKKHMKQLTKNF